MEGGFGLPARLEPKLIGEIDSQTNWTRSAPAMGRGAQ